MLEYTSIQSKAADSVTLPFSTADTAERRNRLSRPDRTAVAVESVEMKCLVHVFGGTLLGLRVQSDDGAAVVSRG